jgi:hypothetical protein
VVREYIYTTPGAGPVSFDTATPVPQQNVGAAVAGAMSSLPTLPAQILDFALTSLRALGTVPEILRQSGGGDTAFDVATQGQGFTQEPFTRSLAKATEQNIPGKFFTPALENILTGGQRENIVQRVGETPFMLGEVVGGLGTMLGLASKAPIAFTAFDKASDVASLVPSQAILNMAKTPLGTLGAGAGIGAASSVLPAVDAYYNAQTGQTDPQAAALTMGLGTGLGALIPGALMAPQLAKQGKQVLDDIVKGATGMIKQSDDMQIVKQINQRALERQQMEAFTQVAKEQMDSLPPPRIPEVPEQYRVEKTFGKETFGYEEIPDSRQALRDEMQADIGPVQKELDDLIIKKQELETNIPVMQKELESLPETIGKKFSVDSDNSLEGTIADILSSNKIDNQSYKQIADLDSASARQFTSKEKGRALDDLSQEIESKLGVDVTGDATEQLNIQEKIVEFTKKYKSAKDYYRQRAQAELDIKRQEIGESFTKAQQELKQLEQDIPGRQEYIANQQEQYKARDNTKLPVLREPEPPARFIASKEGIKEIGPDGVEIPIIKFDETAPKTGVQEDGTIVVKGKQPVDTQQPVTPRATLEPSGKHNANFVPMVNAIKRISKPIGNLIKRYSSESRMIQQEMQKEFKPLKDILLKYQNDDVAMAAIRRQDLENVPEELRNAVQEYQEIFKDKLNLLKEAGLDINADVDFYLPFRVKDVAKLKGKLSQDEQQIIADVFGSAEKAQYNDPEKIRILNRRLEKSRANMKITPDMMIDYHSMPEALDRYISETADQVSQALLFDGDISGNFYTDLLPRLLAKDTSLTPDKQQLVQNQLIRMFGDKNYIAEPMLKAYQSVLGSLTVTGPSTLLAQASSVMSNLHKFGLPSTLSGMYSTLKGLGKLDKSFVNALNPRILQELNDQGQIRVIGGLLDFIKNKRLTTTQKIGKGTQEAIFAPLKAADFMEKESTYNTAYSWLKSKVGSKRFKLFLDEYAGAFSPEEALKLEQDLLLLKKNPKQPITKEVLLATDFLAGERLVLDFVDKSGGALSPHGLERAMHSLMSYSYKVAADETDRTVGLFTQAIKEKNWDKANLAAQNTASLFTILLPGMILFENFKKGRPLEENVTPQRMVRAGLETVMPTTNRALSTAYRLQTSPNADEIIGNLVLPGSGTVLKTVGSAAKLAAEGRPQDIYNPEENPQYRYMPPRVATEYIYSKSDAFKQKQADQLAASSPTLKAERDMTLLKDANKAGLLNLDNVTDLKSVRKDLTKLGSMKSNLKYGTLDPLQAKQIEIIQKALPRQKERFRQQLEAKRSSMSKAQYEDLLKREDEIIMNKLIEWVKSGHIL